MCRDKLIQIYFKKFNDNYDFAKVTHEVCANFEAITRDKALTVAFLKISKRGCYGSLLDILENKFSLGTDQYPVSIPSALTTTDCCGKTHMYQPRHQTEYLTDEDGIGTPFVQAGILVSSTNGATHEDITCYGCQGKGHYRNMCPSSNYVQLVQFYNNVGLLIEDINPYTFIYHGDDQNITLSDSDTVLVDDPTSNDIPTDSDDICRVWVSIVEPSFQN